jgi:hypothetical protein
VEDIATAIAHSAAFVGSSLHGCITALAFGRPFVVLNFDARSKLDGFAELVDCDGVVARDPGEIATTLAHALARSADDTVLTGLQRDVDEHFDRVAGIVEAAWARRNRTDDAGPQTYAAGRLEAELAQLRSAHEAQAQRVRAERRRLADHIQEVHEELMQRREDATRLRETVDTVTAAARAAEARASDAERELGALRATRTFRYLAAPRRAYAWLRGRFR